MAKARSALARQSFEGERSDGLPLSQLDDCRSIPPTKQGLGHRPVPFRSSSREMRCPTCKTGEEDECVTTKAVIRENEPKPGQDPRLASNRGILIHTKCIALSACTDTTTFFFPPGRQGGVERRDRPGERAGARLGSAPAEIGPRRGSAAPEEARRIHQQASTTRRFVTPWRDTT